MRSHTLAYMIAAFGALTASVPAALSDSSELDRVIRGGRLWDCWWAETQQAAPTGTPPLGTDRVGEEAFRCVTCHGWNGADIVVADRTDAQILYSLSRPAHADGHGLVALGLTEQDLGDLVAYLRNGTIDPQRFIDANGQFKGDPDQGRQHFEHGRGGLMQCVVCHGPDGTWLNFGTHAVPQWIGTIASEMPEALMHKVRFGQPGSVMPGWLASGGNGQDVADIGAFAQAELPAARTAAATYEVVPTDIASPRHLDGATLHLAPPEPIGWDAEPDGQPLIAHVLATDLDRDGRLDVVACDVAGHRVTWLRQTADGTFSEMPLGGPIDAPVHAEVADIDADGDLDVIVAAMGVMLPSNDEIGSVIVLENDGDQSFQSRTLIDGIRRVTDVRAGDIDGDGDLDLAVSQFGYVQGEIRWMENLGDWKFTSHHLMDRSGAIHGPLVDLDADGDLDMVVLFSQEWEAVHAFINDGRGSFTPIVLHDVSDADFSSSGIAIGDIDSDGDPDIAWTNGDAFVSVGYRPLPTHGLQWLENLGNYKFAFHRLGHFDGAYGPMIADFDGDGDQDIAAVSEFAKWEQPQTPSIRWWAQQPSGRFAPQDLGGSRTHLVTATAGDFDGDGQPDIIAGGMALYPPFDRVPRIARWTNLGLTTESASDAVLPSLPAKVVAEANAAASPGHKGMILHANAANSEADAAYLEAERSEPTNARWPYYRGILDLRVGDSGAAIKHFERASMLAPEYATLHSRLGELYLGQGNLSAAEGAFLQAGNAPEALTGLAQLAALQQDWPAVITILDGQRIPAAAALLAHARSQSDGATPGPLDAVDMGLQPEDPWLEEVHDLCMLADPIIVRSHIAYIAGDIEKAERLLRRSASLAPDDADTNLALATLLLLPSRATAASVSEAVSITTHALETSPTDIELRSKNAWARSLLGQTDVASAMWSAILDEQPSHAPSLFHLAQLNSQQGSTAVALDFFRRGVAVPRDTAFSGSFEGAARAIWLLQYGVAAKAEGHIDEALSAFGDAIELTPNDPTPHFRYGNLLIGRKRFSDALPHLQFAAAAEPNSGHMQTALGYAFLQLNRPEEAVVTLERAVVASPDYALAWFHLASAQLKVGQRDAAIISLRQAVSLRPDFRRAHAALNALLGGS
ncbi:MAG: tetratricopeptide repeat protein [Planctomycetes bacterium]|nr:tetratricopeptide repeat protein [Planctomycetota bacterium]MCP4839893.1 tetratricopeptide repeat protein [Planctomycetota bacterium]